MVRVAAAFAVFIAPRRRFAAALWVSLLGCAGAQPDPWPSRPAHLGDARVADSRDVGYTPRAQEHGRAAQGTLALRAGGARAQAHATALRFVAALVQADAAALAELFAPRVALTIDATQKSRDELIERCLKDTRTLIYATEHDPARLIDLEEMRVAPATSAPLPAGIEAGDWIVTLPPRDTLDQPARRVPCIATLYIRTGPQDQVVGLAR